MQKLKKKITPIGTPQAYGNCGAVIKHDCEVGQVLQPVKTFFNSSDVDKPSKEEKQDSRVPVYILNMRGQPLMPTTPKKARMLLKQNKATVKYRSPFTIQLLYPTGESKQNITLGIDAGYSYIGFSANTSKKEVISGEVQLLINVSKRIQERARYRRNRRNRLWYRKPRFLNRKRKDGWLAPSIQHKFDTHVRIIEKLKKILPISKIIIETAKFDAQKLQNPKINGIEYQQGTLQGTNVKQYLLEKWGYRCVYCKKKNIPLEIEHIIPRSRRGSNRVSNLTISCRDCNQKKGSKTAEEFGYPDVQKQAKKPLKGAAFMNIVYKRLAKELECESTFGYITKFKRKEFGLDKSHVNDAFVVANGSNQERCKPFKVKQIRRNNRSIQLNRKGFKPSIRKRRYPFQPFDLIRCNYELYRVAGMFSYGRYCLINDLEGNPIRVNGKRKYLKTKEIELVNYGKGLQFY